MPRSFMILDIYLSCLCFRHTGTLFVGSIKCVFCTLNGGGAVLPFQYRTPTSKWGQSTQITNKLSPIRDCGPKGVKARSFQVSATSSPEGKHYIFFCCFSFPLFLFDLFLCFLYCFFLDSFCFNSLSQNESACRACCIQYDERTWHRQTEEQAPSR